MKTQTLVRGAFPLLALSLVLVSCQTVNKFNDFNVQNTTMAFDLKTPPAATFKINYKVTLDSHNPVGSALSIGTSIVKANEAANAEDRMRQALGSVNVPEILLQEAEGACTAALDVQVDPEIQSADFQLALDIHEYGLEADSPWQGVRLNLRVTASLYHNQSRELVWRRVFSVHQSASPQMFGVPSPVGDIMTAAALSELSTEDLSRGFNALAVDTARSIAHRMEDDFYKAHFRD
jgi:hypothetical protein